MNAQIVLDNVGMRLPNRLLFEEINWTLYEGMRVALAGRNGTGKSTLMKIMALQAESTTGQCTLVGGKNLKIGFLDQSLLDSAVLSSKNQKDQSLSPLAYISKELEKENHEYVEMDWEIRKILGGLGFSQKAIEEPMSHLSGGWLLRIFIAKALLAKPQVLLLDEPTNHLDLSSIQWLEEFLRDEYEGSLLLITHDIALQKRTTDSLAILHGGRFYFKKHLQDYLSFRDSLVDEKINLEKNIESIKKKIEVNMDFVYKFRAKAQTAARAQSKLKGAEVMKEELAQVQDRLNRIQGFTYNMSFRFRLAGTGAKFPLSAKGLSFKYKENSPWILKNVTFDIKRGQRIAIIGDNGAGKTTLLNVLASRLTPNEGELEQGHNIEMGYFGQHQLDELSLENSVIDNLKTVAIGVSYEELRGWLGAFGFASNDDVDKKARVLSGGERARLAMLKILVSRINVCLLDEPTNHLDIETKDLLKNAIRDFEGTTIFVSHDREFISDVADRIIYLTTDHQLTDHLGNLESFFEKYPQFVKHTDGKKRTPSQMLDAPKETSAPKNQLSYEERKKIRNQIKSLEKKSGQAEQDIERIGKEKEELAQEPQSPETAKKLSMLESQLHTKMIEWEKWSGELEKLKVTSE